MSETPTNPASDSAAEPPAAAGLEAAAEQGSPAAAPAPAPAAAPAPEAARTASAPASAPESAQPGAPASSPYEAPTVPGAAQQSPVAPSTPPAPQAAPHPYTARPAAPAQPAAAQAAGAHPAAAQPTAAQPTQQLPPAFGGPAVAAPAAAPAEKKQRGLAVPLAATAIVAALLGGGAGAGVAAWALTTQGTDQAAGTSTPQTITIDNPDKAAVVTAVAAKAAPSVVTISVSSSTSGGSGSGVILSEDGYILTNNHVVTLDGASASPDIEITTFDGRIFTAEVVGLDPIVDLAVLKIDGADNLTPIEWGDSDELEVGAQVVAIGAPLGLANTVTDGIVSALERSIQVASSAAPDDGGDATEEDDNNGFGPFDFWNFDDRRQPQQSRGSSTSISIPVIQTDAAINPGNSGGALVDAEGRLVGINVAIASTGGFGNSQSGSIGVGFAIPSALAQRVAEELIANGTATHGLLGATVSSATSEDSDVVGAVIQELVGGGAAEQAGLKPGDVVTRFAGKPITSSIDLTAQVRALAAGSTAELEYVRDGKRASVQVVLGTLS